MDQLEILKNDSENQIWPKVDRPWSSGAFSDKGDKMVLRAEMSVNVGAKSSRGSARVAAHNKGLWAAAAAAEHATAVAGGRLTRPVGPKPLSLSQNLSQSQECSLPTFFCFCH